jgi:hypothetical protein
LKILGSNFILKDRNLLFSTKKPYSLVSGIGLKEKWLPVMDEFRNWCLIKIDIQQFEELPIA